MSYGVCVSSKCVFLALLQELCTILLVYGVLFDTSGAHNRGDSRVDRGERNRITGRELEAKGGQVETLF